uniref:NADH-ubiquinone oxidoreductase chain 2 n=1 Tax=Osedax rubiplumus TaxID=283784 RepID=A0A6M4AFS1_OSERU|nr:NADH dehydrogenase subunit 2 [Osedax rubiplumus]
MPLLKCSSPMFSFTLILSTISVLSASHWFFMWMMMELNLFSFIPLIFSSSSINESESAIKYFLAQAMGSSILFIFIILNNSQTSFTSLLPILLITSMLIKLGAAPCHFWFPSVMNSMSWISCFILSSWQKISPLFILSFFFSSFNNYTLIILGILNSLVGGIYGINQSSLRTMLAYSSISHLGWMLVVMNFSMSTLLMYFITYIMMILPIMMISHSLSVSYKPQLFSSSNLPRSMMLLISLLFLSMSGLPPFLGFFPKWIVLQSMVASNLFLYSLLLIMSSLLTSFFYLNFMLTLSMKSFQSMTHLSPSISSISSVSSISFLMIMIMPSLLAI